MACADSILPCQRRFRVGDYDLAATLDSGQAFRWTFREGAWEGVVGNRWVRLQQTADGIAAATPSGADDWVWLEDYLRIRVNLERVFETLPADGALQDALRAHRGLRLLRQDPWECLASFILSSTKQIVHIKQIVERLCRQHGEPVLTFPGDPPAHTFPAARRVAALTEPALRSLGMGFRAPYLLEAARRVASGQLKLEGLREASADAARSALTELPGVGRKIADCVLLFALGFDAAFPVDVWVMRTLRSVWFADRAVTLPHLVRFAESHFGPYGGYAQQYLFHHARLAARRCEREVPA